MRTLSLFIIACFLSSFAAYGCGFWPYGEDVRFSLFLPSYFNYKAYTSFNYNAVRFGDESSQPGDDPNIADWYRYTGGKVPQTEIATLLYKRNIGSISPESDNAFVRFLYQHGRKDVIAYLLLAKECEDLNGQDIDTDPWERNGRGLELNRKRYLQKLDDRLRKEQNSFLLRRYAFLSIRLAWYDKSYEQITSNFNRYFRSGKKDFLYYWSLYFYCFTDEATGTDIANVMVHCPEKRDASYYYFQERFELESALVSARTHEEQAAVYAYASLQKVDRSLSYLRQIYQLEPGAEVLGFLLLREINKLEDWIYTPYYSNYTPSIEQASLAWEEEQEVTTRLLHDRSERDRQYAAEVLELAEQADLSKVNDPILWQAARIQLLFMTRQYGETIRQAVLFARRYPKAAAVQETEQVMALAHVAAQQKGKAVIPGAARPVILKNINYAPFLFAMGRELEYLGDLPDATALMSFVNQRIRYDDGYTSGYVFWQGNRLAGSSNMRYFSDYFDYTDFVYTADDVHAMITRLGSVRQDGFYNILYSRLQADRNYLLDLLGTKYLREDRLNDALAAFRNAGNQYWEENYNSWERDKYDDGYYAFDNNPFFDFKHTPGFVDHEDKFRVNKLSVTEHLIRYLALANESSNARRDYYYFLAGNCYFNMSQYGNAWMMRRFSATYDSRERESYVDEEEYRNNNLARHYYDQAFRYARNRKFKALCLRMKDYANGEWPNRFTELDEQFPEYAGALSGCDHLREFMVFGAW